MFTPVSLKENLRRMKILMLKRRKRFFVKLTVTIISLVITLLTVFYFLL